MNQAASAANDPPRLTPGRLWLWAELVVLFGGAPLLFTLRIVSMRWLMPALFGFALACLVYLLWSKSFRRVRLWHGRGLRRHLGRVAGVFGVGALGLVGLMAALTAARDAGWIELADEVQWLALPRRNPGLWAAIMIGYPLVSVYPQEIIYRAFMFHRYRAVLPARTSRIVVSAVAFGWVHIVFQNEVAVVLTVIGGLLFAWTYSRSRSLAAVWLEHALYGCLVFTLGLGWLFYGGSVRG